MSRNLVSRVTADSDSDVVQDNIMMNTNLDLLDLAIVACTMTVPLTGRVWGLVLADFDNCVHLITGQLQNTLNGLI